MNRYYYMGMRDYCNSLHSSMGADQYGPTPDFQGPMTPEMLANLDRQLTPEEQKIVDDFQSKVADAAQKEEESKPFINPATGKKTVIRASYQEGDSPGSKVAKKPNYWLYGGLAALAVALIYGVSQ